MNEHTQRKRERRGIILQRGLDIFPKNIKTKYSYVPKINHDSIKGKDAFYGIEGRKKVFYDKIFVMRIPKNLQECRPSSPQKNDQGCQMTSHAREILFSPWCDTFPLKGSANPWQLFFWAEWHFDRRNETDLPRIFVSTGDWEEGRFLPQKYVWSPGRRS